jgi:hypothetical protein
VIKAGGELKSKITQKLEPICVTDREQNQRFPDKCNGLIQVFGIASETKACGELKNKIIQ